jgi:hypothetical protein
MSFSSGYNPAVFVLQRVQALGADGECNTTLQNMLLQAHEPIWHLANLLGIIHNVVGNVFKASSRPADLLSCWPAMYFMT